MMETAINKNQADVPILYQVKKHMPGLLSFFDNLDSLKVMLVLYRDNPDVSFTNLQKEVHIETNLLAKLLADLIQAEVIHVRSEADEQLFTLSLEARMGLNRFQTPQLIGKTVKSA